MKKVIFISSEGGHLYELEQIDFSKYDYLIVTEKTDSTKNLPEKYGKDRVRFLKYGTRKTLIKYCFMFLGNIRKSRKIFKSFNPDVVVSTGTHTAVPMCYIAKMHGKKVIWIETFANRNSKTLAGRLVYPIVDCFVVQWKEMQKKYKKAKYWGQIF